MSQEFTNQPVTATDLDVRDLDAAQDTITVHGDVGVIDQFDLANSNPVTVAIVDGSGDQITSFGGGTQYTEDAAAAANPVGTVTILVRQDTPATLVDTDGDNVARRGTNYGAAYTQIVTSAGAFVDTFGGGTQYTEGDTDASITGTAMMMEGAANTLVAAQGTAADGLLVNLGTNNDVTVTGTVTANAGTNLNTSALNLETTQSSVLTSVQLIDDTIVVMGTDTYTEAASKGQNITAVRRDADTTLVDTTNEFGPLQMDANGRLKVEVFSGETLPISGTVTATATDLDIRNLVAATDAVSVHGDVGVLDQLDLTNSNPAVVAIVDGNGDQITSFGGGTEYAQGTATTDTDVLKMAGAVRRDTAAVATGVIDGDRLALSTDSAGRLRTTSIDVTQPISAASLPLPTGAATLAEQQTQTTALQLIDDTVVVLGTATYAEATTKANVIGAVRRDADTTLVDTTNEIAPLQVDANGRLKVEVFSGETLPISGTVTATATDLDIRDLTQASDSVAIGDGTNAVVVVTDGADNLSNANNELVTAALTYAFDGTNWDRVTIGGGVEATALRVTIASDSTGVLSVDDNGSSLTVDAPVGTPVNVQIGNATLSAGVIDETGAAAVDALAVGGGTAHDAVDSGNPIKVGGVAVSGSATPTSVAAADRTRWIFNQHGIPYMLGGHPNLITREFDFGAAAQTDLNLAAAVVAADERIYVTRFEALCDNANTVAVAVRAGFGTANVPTASATGVNGMIGSHPGIAAGSGIMCGNGAGIIAVGGAGEEPRLTTSAATSGNLHVIISYFLVDETP